MVYTGDETQMVIYIVVGVVALIAVAAVLILTKPKKTKDVTKENEPDKE